MHHHVVYRLGDARAGNPQALIGGHPCGRQNATRVTYHTTHTRFSKLFGSCTFIPGVQEVEMRTSVEKKQKKYVISTIHPARKAISRCTNSGGAVLRRLYKCVAVVV